MDTIGGIIMVIKIKFLSAMLLGAGTATALLVIPFSTNAAIVGLLLATIIVAAAIDD